MYVLHTQKLYRCDYSLQCVYENVCIHGVTACFGFSLFLLLLVFFFSFSSQDHVPLIPVCFPSIPREELHSGTLTRRPKEDQTLAFRTEVGFENVGRTNMYFAGRSLRGLGRP